MTVLPRRLRLQDEAGQTLVELLIAMMVLTVGIPALISAYSSGYVSFNGATRVSSATLVADSQMEDFEALQFSAIQLNTACGTTCTEDSTCTGDSAYNSVAQVTGCATTATTRSPLKVTDRISPDPNPAYWIRRNGRYSVRSIAAGCGS